MGLLKGAVGISRYKVEGKLPEGFWEWLNQRIKQNIFMDIEGSTVDKSLGWVSAHDYFDADFAFESYNLSPYVVLGLRQDKRSVPASLVRKYHRLEIKQFRELQPTAKLSKPDREMLKEKARLMLLTRIPPQTTTWEMSWNTMSNEVWFTTSSRGNLEISVELFAKSFQPLFLTPRLPYLSAGQVVSPARLDLLTPVS